MRKCLAIPMICLALACASQALAQARYEFPCAIKGEQIIHRKAYSISHSPLYNLSNWVAYVLTASETRPVVSRREGVFKPDPEIEYGPDSLDYIKSGYDRGHLAPAADMESEGKAVMQESFYFSNIAPQAPAFNRGIWRRLECLQRLWASEYDSIYIITGPVLRGKLKSIGDHNVAVPRYFYKVIMRRDRDGSFVGAGFVLPNRDSRSRLADRMVSIDSVEAFTGIDFFCQLPAEIEGPMESVACRECWNWHDGDALVEPQSRPSSLAGAPGQAQGSGKPVQCKGITRSGKRCTRTTYDKSGFCYQHKK